MVGQPSSKSQLHSFGSLTAASVALAPALVLAGAVAVLNPGVQFERGVASAAAVESRIMAANASPVKAINVATANRPYEEGSEGFWLTRAPDADNVSRVAWKAPVAVGDRVVVNFGSSDRQVLDVISVEGDLAAPTRIDTGLDKSERYVITGRSSAAPSGDLIRLTVDSDGRGITALAGTQDRAL
jgi:hypothetical protein